MASPSTSKTPDGGKVEGTVTPFQPGLIERVAGALRYAITGNAPAWFGPNEPMKPQAPDTVKGRPLDFQVGQNLAQNPRSESTDRSDLLGPDPFGTLRRAADPAQGGLDLLRLAIETRKDQMEAQKWTLRPRDPKDTAAEERAKDLMVALRRPDLVHTFNVWARQLWEDMLVIDAPTLYLRPLPEGFRIPEVMDGALMKRLVDQNGRTPLPPEPAFQQILKGMPAVNYTLDEVIYSPRNLRSYKYYGMAPVEQVVNILALALKRQAHLMGYYTAGNIPEHLVGTPTDWQPDQIQQAQEWLDGLMEDNLKSRRKLIFIPGGMAPIALKDTKLQDPLDEWLARVICWAFNLPPSALVKEVNRSTAETAQETGQQEGLEPLKIWWKAVMDEVLARCWGAADLEFAFEDEEIADPQTKVTYWTGWVTAKVVTPDEVRTKVLGWDPLTQEQKDELNPPPPPGLRGPEMGGPGEPEKGPGKPQGAADADGSASQQELPPAKEDPADKVEKKKSMKAINRDRPAAVKAGRRIRKALNTYWKAQKAALVAAVRAQVDKVQKMDMDAFLALWDELPEDARKELAEALEAALADLAEDGAAQALGQVVSVSGSLTSEDLDAMLSQANERAVEWAADRAADLVGMKRDENGEWITNPNPKWAIDDTTRGAIQDLVTQATEEGWTNDQLADAIGDSVAFDDARAEMVARTETAFADVAGNLEGYRASGVVQGKRWILGDEACDACQALDGVTVGLDEAFPGEGGDGPPLHPNCRCDVTPVLMDPGESEA